MTLTLTIDKTTELVTGEKISEPKAKIVGRVNHKTLEFELLVNYDVFSEQMSGQFVFDDYSVMEGVVYNERAGFTKEDGNDFIVAEV